MSPPAWGGGFVRPGTGTEGGWGCLAYAQAGPGEAPHQPRFLLAEQRRPARPILRNRIRNRPLLFCGPRRAPRGGGVPRGTEHFASRAWRRLEEGGAQGGGFPASPRFPPSPGRAHGESWKQTQRGARGEGAQVSHVGLGAGGAISRRTITTNPECGAQPRGAPERLFAEANP